jgi:hypothetical protein
LELIKNSDVANVISRVKPLKIAVAYIGIDYKKYIDLKNLLEIIVSPTIGTNPYAIKEIVNKIGWGNVYFLDNLHAKIYMGSESAAIGSFNLSENGFGVQGLEEIGVLVTENDVLDSIDREFDRLKGLACLEYKEQIDKERKLEQLLIRHKLAIEKGFIEEITKNRSFLDYVFVGEKDFYVMPFSFIDSIQYNDAIIKSKVPDLSYGNDYLHDEIENSTSILPGDPISQGDWILLWESTRLGNPKCRNGLPQNVKWLYVHHVIPNAQEDAHSTLVIQRLKKDGATPPPPFNIDSREFLLAFDKVIKLKEFNDFRYGSSNNPWSVLPSLKKYAEFFLALKQEMSNNVHVEQ